MSIHDLSAFRHDHAFDSGNRAGERRTWIVVAITATTMVAEIVAGWITGSMALLADGWHMATHVVALSIAGIAYWLARRWSGDERFASAPGRSRCWAPSRAPCSSPWWRSRWWSSRCNASCGPSRSTSRRRSSWRSRGWS